MPPAPAEASSNPLVKIADAVDRVIALSCEFMLLLTGVVLMSVLTANVTARYILSTGGFDWAEEVPEQLFPWFIAAGVALAVQKGGHIGVEWLLGRLNRNATRVLLLAGHVLVFAAYLLLTALSMDVAQIVAVERSPVLGLPKTYGYWAIAVACFLVAISTLAMTVRLALIGPEAMPSPSPEEMPT